MQRQKMTEHALYRKNSAAMFIVMYGQLHPEIITIAKRSTSPDFTTVVQEQDVVGLLSILQSICVKNLTSSRVDPYSKHLNIEASTLSYVQTKDVSNDDFRDAILDQVTAAQSQCGNFVFGEQYHLKVLSDDGLSSLTDYFNLGTDAERETYDEKARQLVCARLIINNSLSNKTRVFLQEQYVVNHSNYPDTVVEAVAMITSFGNDSGGGKGGKNNNNTNKNPDAIVSIHLAKHGVNCSDDNNRSVGSFESTANGRGTNDDSELPDVLAPVIDSEFGNDNSEGNV